MTAPHASKPLLSNGKLAMLSVYWLVNSAYWAALLIVLMPLQVLSMVGDARKGRALGSVLLFGALMSVVVVPLAGVISDRWHGPYGRRRPFVVVGTLLNVVALLGMAYLPRAGDARSLYPYIGAFILVQIASSIATAPYAALIPDVVPLEQRGAAAGWLGLMTMLGNAAGAMTGLLLRPLGGMRGAYLAVCALLLAGMMVAVLGVDEPPAPRRELEPLRPLSLLKGLLSPLATSRDFRWVFITRFLVNMGIFTVQEFLLFYMRDVVRSFRVAGRRIAEGPEQAVTLFVLALLLGAVASSLVAGVLSDRYGRKRIVALSAGCQAVVALVFMFFGSFTVALAMGLLFGLGYGAFQAVDWALATDVLPSADDHARDLAVWNASLSLPQVIATPVAGVLLDHFQNVGRRSGYPTLGYTVIFALAVTCFVLGTVFVRQIRGAR